MIFYDSGNRRLRNFSRVDLGFVLTLTSGEFRNRSDGRNGEKMQKYRKMRKRKINVIDILLS